MRKIIIIATVCAVYACNYKKLEEFVLQSDQFDVTFQQATTVASNIHKSDFLNKSILKNRQNRILAKTIKSSLPVPDSQNPSYFIFNYENGVGLLSPLTSGLNQLWLTPMRVR